MLRADRIELATVVDLDANLLAGIPLPADFDVLALHLYGVADVIGRIPGSQQLARLN